MYNPFTKHPRINVGETWWEHCQFAVGVGIRLFLTSMYFLLHGLFPFIELHTKWNLECASKWLYHKNENRERLKKIVHESRKIKKKFPPNDFPLTEEGLEKWKKKVKRRGGI